MSTSDTTTVAPDQSWLDPKRADLNMLRGAIRQGRLAPAKLAAILAALRKTRARPDIHARLADSIDSVFRQYDLSQATK